MIPPRLRDNIPLYLSSIFTPPPSTPRSSPVLHFLFDNSLFIGDCSLVMYNIYVFWSCLCDNKEDGLDNPDK